MRHQYLPRNLKWSKTTLFVGNTVNAGGANIRKREKMASVNKQRSMTWRLRP